ncbi:MAG: hypothetical protein Q9195_003029 [Heterodermia aff. obscurata]
MASSTEDANAIATTLVDKSKIYCSAPFKFLIGDTAIYVHVDLITQCSKPLEKMIHGSMVEAKQGFATLEDVDLNTFLRFVQWLYHGYYDPASPQNLAASAKNQAPDEIVQQGQTNLDQGLDDFVDTTNDHSLEEAAPAVFGTVQPVVWGFSGSSQSRIIKKNKKPYSEHSNSWGPSLKESFIRRDYKIRNIKNSPPQPRPNSTRQEDYSEVFLGHARLYVFADKYDIQTLKQLAIEELHATLAVYTLYKEGTGDIVALLRYVYANTAEYKSGVEDLRTLLTQYMEVEMNTLIKDNKLQELMLEDGGPLLADVMKVMKKRFA